jgi:glutamate/tyrosine decarboxylase-like PLP-dependent enzyme
MTVDTGPDIGGWRSVLTAHDTVSRRFAHRYAILLADAQTSADDTRLERAAAIAATHPRRALSVLLGVETSPAQHPDRTWTIVRRGTDTDTVKRLLATGGLDQLLAEYPDLEQTWVPLHPDRHAKSIVLADGRRLAALRWPAESVGSRNTHQERMRRLVLAAGRRAGLPVRVWDDYTICAGQAPHVWAITRNLGTTVEDRLRDPQFGGQERQMVVQAIAALRQTMIDHGLIWQGFAPRNMFFADGRLVLIDFEETVLPAEDPARAAECLLWHKVFFADGLTDDEKRLVFAGEPEWFCQLVPDLTLPADAFEAALLGTSTVSWRTRAGLLAESARLEGRHRRPAAAPRGAFLFGHEIGHFWGDFVAPQVEAAIFRGLARVTDPRQLCALMEVFEAAMEADILRIILARAAGAPDLSTPYTDGLAQCLTDHAAAGLIEARERVTDWYAHLDMDPRSLVNAVVFDVQTAADIDPEVFIGVPGRAQDSYDAVARAVKVGVGFVHRRDTAGPVVRFADNDELRALVAERLPVDGCRFDDLLAHTADTVVRHSILQSHPGYLAFPDSANALAAVAGGLLGKLLNQNLIAVERSAPAATFVEVQTIAWLRELVGYPTSALTQMRGVKDVGGLWTTGGHLSNHVAMLAALGARFPQARRGGLRSLDTAPAVIMAGPIAHYSHSDAAFHLGLGWDAVIGVDARPGYTTDVDAVEKALADPPAGQAPFMVVGVAGNCRTTGLDDLAGLADVCRRYRVWLHVDACHGGSLIFSQRLRARHLAGLGDADSISLDPHKGLFTPYPSSYVLFRDPGVLTQFSRHAATVGRDDCWDLGLITPFLGSRGFESLATWMMLRHIGVARLGELVERRQALVRHLARRIDASGLFVALNDVDFYRVAFVLCPPEARAIITGLDTAGRTRAAKAVSAFTCELNTALYQEGKVCFDEHTLADLADRVGAGNVGSYTVMAACPGNPNLTMADLDHAVDRLIGAARPVAARLIAHLRHETTAAPMYRHGGPAGWSDA